MHAIANNSNALTLNAGTDPLSTLRFRSLDDLKAALASQGCVVVERDIGRSLKRANFELMARNVVGSGATAHSVTEYLFVIRAVSFGPYGGGANNTQYELQLAGTVTWNFTAGSAREIPPSQMPSDAEAFQRFNVATGASVVASGLLLNEVNADVKVTSLAVGPVVHVQDGGATVGYVRHFTGMNASLIQGVLAFNQLFD